ncbi:MAG: hypothetical protein RSC36_08000, partial [Ruthenibacterium sp.]
LGLHTDDLKLFSAAVVAAALGLPYLRGKYGRAGKRAAAAAMAGAADADSDSADTDAAPEEKGE